MADPVTIAERLAPRLAQRAAGYDLEAAFPQADIDDIRQAGLLALLVPERLGGLGAEFADYARVAMALAQGSGATALLFNMHASVTGALAGVPDELARQLGAPEEFFDSRDRILRRAAEGAMYGVAITERSAGSRLSALQTSYAPEGGGYQITGEKSVCSGAGFLDGYLVAARAEGRADADAQISYFLVPAGAGAVATGEWDPLGMRATASRGLRLDARVPADALIGFEGLALLLAYALPQWLVASYAAVYVGLAQSALAHAVEHLRGREAVATPGPAAEPQRGALTRLASVRARVGRADAQIEAARAALEEAARRVDLDPGKPETNRAVYRAKLLAGDVAMDISASLCEACGLGALSRPGPLERIFRDARCGAVMPPSSDVCADYLGTAALGLDQFTGTDVRPW